MNGNARAPRATSASHASYPSTDTAHGWESFPIAAARAPAFLLDEIRLKPRARNRFFASLEVLTHGRGWRKSAEVRGR